MNVPEIPTGTPLLHGPTGIAARVEDALTSVKAAVEDLQGRIGEAGEGIVGPAGPTGPIGAMGPQGAKGDTGDSGPQGERGLIGLQGPQGSVGPAGADGAPGAAGATGAQGLKGDKGDTGTQGPQGDTGPAGTPGADGAQGLRGFSGMDGATGPTGATGSTGAQGPQGIQGLKGDTGDAGATGPTGAQGPQGIQGIQGPAGTDASIPSGLIAMWSGLLVNVPSGWHLCDGLGGTPDLRSKFVKGAAAGIDPGVTGGAASQSYTPAGTQGAPTVADHASHTHTSASSTASPKLVTSNTSSGVSLVTGGPSATLAHSVTAPGTFSGTPATIPTEPPYYALAFIMKL